MTQNQIAYWNLRESERHNLSTEQESKRHNIVGEKETYRHNITTEGETQRHNVMTENISIADLQERGRHNRATEAETYRHNVETENLGRDTLAETSRHNRETERQGDRSLDIQLGNLSESIRHNKATESETNRHNIAGEQYNVANLSETQRANLEKERLNRESLLETGRHNVETEKSNQLAAEARMESANAQKESNRIKKAKDDADIKQRAAEIAIKRFESVDRSKLTTAQIKEINQSISKMRQDIKASKTNQTVSIWNAINNSANAVARIIDAIIPL